MAARQGRTNVGSWIIALVAWFGVILVLYPSIAGWFSQYNQSQIIGNAATVSNRQLDQDRQQHLDDAHAYNDDLAVGAEYAANSNVPTSQAGANSDHSYWDLLNEQSDGLMGRIQIPSIDVDLPIYHGTSDGVLAQGIGHLEGTSLPVGGANTHSVLTGHRGLANAVLFTNLNKVVEGDMFSVTTQGQVVSYQVIETKVVKPDQTESLRVQAGKDLITLVTCTPLGINTDRIFVTGQRVIPTPVAAEEAALNPPEIPGFPWWAVWLTVATVACVSYVIYTGHKLKKTPALADDWRKRVVTTTAQHVRRAPAGK